MKNTSNTFIFANKFETLTDDEMIKIIGGKNNVSSFIWKNFKLAVEEYQAHILIGW